MTTPANVHTSETVRGGRRYKWRARSTLKTKPTETGSTRLREGNHAMSSCPGSALAAVDGTALRPSGNRTTSSIRANGPRKRKGKMAGTATTTIPASIDSGRRSPRRPRAAKRASTARGQAVNFMADAMPSTTPEANGFLRCASTMARSKKATTGMSSPPVASGSEARGRMTST